MQITKLDFNNIPQLSKTDKAYTLGNAALKPFYKHAVELNAFEAVIEAKTFDQAKRQILVQELKEQYQAIETTAATQNNIEKLLSPKAYTVVTAHQPNLFTGPLYTIYKIISVTNLAEQLKETYPDKDFVPVFWTGGEDHDFEEVNHINLFGKRFTWEDKQGGPVGAYQTASLAPTLDAVKEVLGQSEHTQILVEQLEACYRDATNYSSAVRQFINWIFGRYGLVIVNANTKAFKAQMHDIFKDELLNQTSKPIVEATANAITEAGFKQQAHVRDINLFYLSPNQRNRIVKADGIYQVLDTNLSFTEAALLEELEQHPERFSPNVVLRPLFQEMILPNLAYIGGGGELAYWLERKTQFEHYQLAFPMLIRRCSVLWIDANSNKKLNKLGLTTSSIFQDTDQLIKDYVLGQTNEELSLATEHEVFAATFQQIADKAKRIDPSLEKSILAQQAQLQKSIDKLEQRLLRAEKRKNETSLEQIRKIKDKFFPKNGLQERHENFLAYYSRYGDLFIETLKEHLNPLEKKFVVVTA